MLLQVSSIRCCIHFPELRPRPPWPNRVVIYHGCINAPGCMRLLRVQIKACTDPRRGSTGRYPWGPSEKQDRDGSSESCRYTLHAMGVADPRVENKPLCLCATLQSRPIVFRHSTMSHILDLPSPGATLFVLLMVLSLFTNGTGIHMDSVGSHSMFTCESIGLRMCQDLPYNTTFMPNLLNHYDQQTAALAMEVREALFMLCIAGVGGPEVGLLWSLLSW